MPEPTSPFTRRAFLWTTLAGGAALVIAACGQRQAASPTPAATAAPPVQASSTPAPASPEASQAPSTPAAATEAPSETAPTQGAPTEAAQALPPTPACGVDEANPTLAQTEGPFYTPDSPERTSLLEPGMAGTPMILTGYVLSTACTPVAGALLDFWHADDAGQYDNVGYRLRGHQFADAGGRFTLETIVPGLYPGRTRHFHVKVQAPNQPVLTTQLYFPGEPDNGRDGLYNAALEMDVTDGPDGKRAAFNFVLAPG